MTEINHGELNIRRSERTRTDRTSDRTRTDRTSERTRTGIKSERKKKTKSQRTRRQ